MTVSGRVSSRPGLILTTGIWRGQRDSEVDEYVQLHLTWSKIHTRHPLIRCQRGFFITIVWLLWLWLWKWIAIFVSGTKTQVITSDVRRTYNSNKLTDSFTMNKKQKKIMTMYRDFRYSRAEKSIFLFFLWCECIDKFVTEAQLAV